MSYLHLTGVAGGSISWISGVFDEGAAAQPPLTHAMPRFLLPLLPVPFHLSSDLVVPTPNWACGPCLLGVLLPGSSGVPVGGRDEGRLTSGIRFLRYLSMRVTDLYPKSCFFHRGRQNYCTGIFLPPHPELQHQYLMWSPLPDLQ